MQEIKIMSGQFTARELRPDDQVAARSLILEGLGERWGWIDENANPDLNDIISSYQNGFFVTVWAEGVLIGTGGISPEGNGGYRVSRMSVKTQLRGAGIGEAILDFLVTWAIGQTAERIVLETTSEWHDAVRFYRNYGFEVIGDDGANTHFELSLDYERPW